jgi:hypothetical protein
MCIYRIVRACVWVRMALELCEVRWKRAWRQGEVFAAFIPHAKVLGRAEGGMGKSGGWVITINPELCSSHAALYIYSPEIT